MSEKKPSAARTFWLLAFLAFLGWMTVIGIITTTRCLYSWLIA